MKFSIERHKKMLEFMKLYNNELEKKVKRIALEWIESLIDTANYEDQINLAEKKGLAAFDSEKFGKKKGKIQ